jgi:3-methyladenine DNA glycosylase Tag
MPSTLKNTSVVRDIRLAMGQFTAALAELKQHQADYNNGLINLTAGTDPKTEWVDADMAAIGFNGASSPDVMSQFQDAMSVINNIDPAQFDALRRLKLEL